MHCAPGHGKVEHLHDNIPGKGQAAIAGAILDNAECPLWASGNKLYCSRIMASQTMPMGICMCPYDVIGLTI